MAIEIIINATDQETRVAILENKTVTEFYLDRKRERGILGNVYKGKVVKVLPGMQAAFVDIGAEKAAFLYVSDVSSGVEDYEKYFIEEENKEKNEPVSDRLMEEEAPLVPYSEEEPELSSDIQEETIQEELLQEEPEQSSSEEEFPPIGKIASLEEIPPDIEVAMMAPEEPLADFTQPEENPESVEKPEEAALSPEPFLPVIPDSVNDSSQAQGIPETENPTEVMFSENREEILLDETKKETAAAEPIQGQQKPRYRPSRHFRTKSRPRRSSRPIETLLKEGQEILVQVSKDAMGTKGPRVTTYVSLPGRYLVFMPTVNHLGISRRIGNSEERGRLKEMLHRLRRPGRGYIIRTVSEGTTDEEFKSDMEFLELLWQSMLKKKEKVSAPALLHTDLDLIFRTVRDLFTKKVDRLVIDSKTEYERIKDFAKMYLQELADRVDLYTNDEPIFDAYEIETEISKALARKVWLKSGGYIVIDRAEALTVIDVNTGRYVGKRDLEDTILKTNLEAAKEIAYQLRLRNIGGIIIIDFIDMEKERNREKVFQSLQEAMSKDKARINILKISELGLIELSRERTRDDIQRILCEPCYYCEGRGHIRSATTICYEIFREIRRVGNSPKERKIIVTVHPSVANLLYDEERQGVDEMEKLCRKRIIIKPDLNMHLEHYNVVMV